jgi:hypothetical protein
MRSSFSASPANHVEGNKLGKLGVSGTIIIKCISDK